MLNQIRRVEIPGTGGTPILFASKPIAEVTKSDIEAVRDARRAAMRDIEATRAEAQRTGTAGPAVRRLTQGGEVARQRVDGQREPADDLQGASDDTPQPEDAERDKDGSPHWTTSQLAHPRGGMML